MQRTTLLALLTLGLATLLFALVWSPPSSADRMTEVFVTNLTNPQPISGKVRVQGTVRHAVALKVLDQVVSPVGRSETTQLADAGVIQTDGFTTLSLSLQGEIKGRPARPGEIGVILLPEEEAIVRAFQQDGEIHLPLEVAAAIGSEHNSYFSATQSHLPIAFPRYRVLIYNSTEKSASVNVYLYLTN